MGITEYRLFTPVVSVDIRHGVTRRKIMRRWTLTTKILFDRRREFNMATLMIFFGGGAIKRHMIQSIQ